MRCKFAFCSTQTELPRIVPEAGFEPATRSSAYLLHLIYFDVFKGRVKINKSLFLPLVDKPGNGTLTK